MNSDEEDCKLLCIEEPPLQKRQKLDNDDDARTSASATTGFKAPLVMMNNSVPSTLKLE